MAVPSPLLLGTVDRVVRELRKAGLLEMQAGKHEEVVRFCAEHLAAAGLGAQLVDSLSNALLASEHVEELYADNEAIKAFITGAGEP